MQGQLCTSGEGQNTALGNNSTDKEVFGAVKYEIGGGIPLSSKSKSIRILVYLKKGPYNERTDGFCLRL